jgi:hypothetical protein
LSLQAISEIATWSLDILSANECRPERLVPGIGAKAPHPSASRAAAAKHTLLRISFDIMTALADLMVIDLAQRFDQFGLLSCTMQRRDRACWPPPLGLHGSTI